MDKAAGVATSKLNTDYKLELKLLTENKRTFEAKGETERSFKKKAVMKKDHQYYNLKQNLWNESEFLYPEIARFSADNIDPYTSFKKEVKDLPKIHHIEREDKFNQQFEKLVKNKSESQNRFIARMTERIVN